MKQNRFGAFADEDTIAAEIKETKVAAKAAEPKKKVVVKVAKAPVEDAEEFEKVQERTQPQRGAQRGGRGGERRGGRGGDRGGRGDRPRGDGERGGQRRGRGDRPRTAMPTAGEDGEQVERTERTEKRRGRGREHNFEGKPREEAHPMDRQDGTGRARRGDKKGGHGKGNWGKETEVVEENKGEERKPREERERKPREERKPEPVVEEEEVGFTLDDYIAAKQAKTQGLYKKPEIRNHEKIDAKNIKDLEYKHDEMATTKLVKQVDTIAMKPNAGSDLLGFSRNEDDVEVRGARGGRGGRGDRPVRQERPQTQRGGRKGGKLVVDDNDFPAL